VSAPGRGAAVAAELRRQFDETFAAPVRQAVEDLQDLLALGVGGTGYAVRLGDVTGLVADRSVTPVPTAVPAFLGLVGLRGSVAPVWSLSALLGHGADLEPPRWLLLVGGQGGVPALALAFGRFDGHHRVPRSQLTDSADSGAAMLAHMRQSVRLSDGARGVLALDVVTREIRGRLGLRGDDEEPI
jgi:purine-binding chemotaxis protein CheW